MENTKQIIELVWSDLKGSSELTKLIHYHGPEAIFPSRFDVTSFSAAAIAAANLAVAELHALRSQKELNQYNIAIDSIEASGAFKSDSLIKPDEFQIPSPWDPFAGDYQCSDYWIRLHTNYSYHLEAALKVLGKHSNKEELAKTLLSKKAIEVEADIIRASGCAAVMYNRESWKNHEHGKYTIDEKIAVLELKHNAEIKLPKILNSTLALTGVKILDLTRVIAGPTCTKFLSAHGADVLHLDPPGFKEVPALLPETTVGKKCGFLNLKLKDGQEVFKELIKATHILVCGLRSDALSLLGFSEEEIYQLNPNLIFVQLNAYGSNGPWKNRRGFDSLVQMSSGIAYAGAKYKNSTKPIPLPFQALDYATGFVMAAGVCRAICELIKNQTLYKINSSLIGASNLLQNYDGNFEIPIPDSSLFDPYLIDANTQWGKCKRFKVPGEVSGLNPHWKIDAGELGRYNLQSLNQ